MLQFTSPLDDPALECQLMDRLLVMHAETDQILAHSRFQDVSLDRVCSVEIQSGQMGLQLHAIETRMVPFDFQIISDAMWDMSMEHEYPRHVILHQDIKADEGIITRVLERSVDLPSGSSRYCGKAVQRWFTGAHRVVVVASMVTDAIQIAGQSFQGACIRTHVWMVLEPATEANAACGSRKPATIRKLDYLAEPEVYDDDMSEKERRATIDVLSNFVLNSVQAKVDTNYQMLENHLLDRFQSLKIENNAKTRSSPS
ncbi:hypothetical protein Poli38472_011852 [Pythium oligandrum]|uniref:Uncharacterized protein n=1 Tax=Pythium oligandrum TaxID=41045 RepID=A0A8K1C883_PYTOL|nr:hypothetical protein Poli38472_011852 [Pythium oligandrum]|eukprot:TMW58264.1 hypothetical protein Poli38472_011852 [Pythium oligandrum]